MAAGNFIKSRFHMDAGRRKAYVANDGTVITGEPGELLVANARDLATVWQFASQSRDNRREFYHQTDPNELSEDDRKFYNKVRELFRCPDTMTPIYDEDGSVRCYEDENHKLYNMFYIKKTLEELPMGAFAMKQKVLTFVGRSNSAKTTMIEMLSIFMMTLITENPAIDVEIANRPGSPVFKVFADICKRFDENKVPGRSHSGIEIQETSFNVSCNDPEMDSPVQMLLQFKDIPGEDFEQLNYGSYINKAHRIPIVVISCNDLLEHHKSRAGYTELDEYLINYSGISADERLSRKYEWERPIFILSNFDVAADNIPDERVRKVWDRGSSIERDGRLHLKRHRDGLRLGEIHDVSHNLLVPFVADYAPTIYEHMTKIAHGEPLIFACASIGEEPVWNEKGGTFEYPEGFVPFNLDEPLLYLMNREGLYPAHEDEAKESRRLTGFFEGLMNKILGGDWLTRFFEKLAEEFFLSEYGEV